MIKSKKKLAEFEESLATEEKELEKIRDSLKGKFMHYAMIVLLPQVADFHIPRSLCQTRHKSSTIRLRSNNGSFNPGPQRSMPSRRRSTLQ